jgi:2-oxoglutarate ferredoxin oxidoreductase subunit alpha
VIKVVGNKISVLIGGEAGAGITRSGFLFAKACLRGGFNVFGTNDYQSLIRGGHNFYIVRAEVAEIYSQADTVDLLLALNRETILFHKDKVVQGGGIIYDGETIEIDTEELARKDLKLYSIPLAEIVKDLKGAAIMRNTVALGATVALIDYDLEILNQVMTGTFKKRVAEINIQAAERGYSYAKEHYEGNYGHKLGKPRTAGERKLFLTGSEAIGLAAIRAGCRFYAAYPMTPATPLLHFLATLDREFGMIVMHAESEIAAINMVAGASFAGVRAMTATSGGGFCLMSEGVGMLGMTETPVVIMMAQRPGPSTGLPTYTSQGDLRFVIHAAQGEFPRVVVAPGDLDECFYTTMEVFNLSERFQVPAIILTDKYLVESQGSVAPFNQDRIGINRGRLIGNEDTVEEEYMRHKFTGNGVSPRAIPGTRGVIVRTNADEHDERGYTNDRPDMRTNMVNQRFRKREALVKALDTHETTKFYGPSTADTTLLGWGSTKGPIREALKLLSGDGVKVNYLHVIYLHPFPANAVKNVLRSSKNIVVVENNKTAQLASLLREQLLVNVNHHILKYDGRPFNPGELAEKIRGIL